MSEINTDKTRAYAKETLPLLLEDGVDEPEHLTDLIVSLADEIDSLRNHIKRHTCKHWDHDELECGD